MREEYIVELKPKTVGSSQDEKLQGQPLIKPSSTNHDLHESIVDACRSVFDPEIPVNIFDLGLIYTIEINTENSVNILMSLTAPGCPVAGEMPGWVASAVEMVPGVKEVKVELIWEPPWGMEMMTDEAKLELGFM